MICDEAEAGRMHRTQSHQVLVSPIGNFSHIVKATANSNVVDAAQFPRSSGMQRRFTRTHNEGESSYRATSD